MKTITVFILMLLINSCSDAPLSPEEELENSLGISNTPTIWLEMSDDLLLTLSVNNFDQTIGILSFELIYNPTSMVLQSYSSGKFGDPWSNIELMDIVNDSTQASFVFNGNIKGSGKLLEIQFSGVSASALKNTVLWYRYLEMYDSGGELIEIEGSDDFWYDSICYIDGYNSQESDGPVYNEFGEFLWSHSFCAQHKHSVLP